jgi:HSP20 family protein
MMIVSLVPYDPFRPLSNMRRDIDWFFSEFPALFDNHHFSGIRVDVHETDNEVIATCDVPGLEKKEDINIHIDNQTLTISGSINRTTEIKKENMYRQERYAGSFHRSISLPSPVSQEGVKATYKNGVLEVRMPKVKSDQRKRIDVDFN